MAMVGSRAKQHLVRGQTEDSIEVSPKLVNENE